jgi:hypothetical protein
VSVCVSYAYGKSPMKKIPPIYPSVGKKLQLLKRGDFYAFKW